MSDDLEVRFSNAERGADLKTGCKNFHKHLNAGIFSHPKITHG